MKKIKWLVIIIAAGACIWISPYLYYWYSLHQLLQGYHRAMYKSYIKGTLHSIDIYDARGYKGMVIKGEPYPEGDGHYVISIMDSAKNATTIGEVAITHFTQAREGDTVIKPANSYQLLVYKNGVASESEISY